MYNNFFNIVHINLIIKNTYVNIELTISGEIRMTSQIIYAKILKDNHLVRIDFNLKKNTIEFNRLIYTFNQLTSINKIGYYSKDNSKLIFVIFYLILQFASLTFILLPGLFIQLSLGSFVFATACAYTSKLFSIHSSIYRIILDDKPYDLLISDLDAYNLNIKKQEPNN